jgi:hypothetical protein
MDPRFWESLERHDALSVAFAKHSSNGLLGTIDLPELLSILRDVDKLPTVCAAETEAFLASRMAADGIDSLSLEHVEALYNAVVTFQAADGLSTEEIAARFPLANAVGDDGRPVLLAAVEDGDDALVEQLLHYGAVADAVPEGGGATALYVAASRANERAVQALMLHGADPHVRVDRMGATPMYIACHKGYAAVVDALLLGGPPPPASLGHTPTPRHPDIAPAHCARVLTYYRDRPPAAHRPPRVPTACRLPRTTHHAPPTAHRLALSHLTLLALTSRRRRRQPSAARRLDRPARGLQGSACRGGQGAALRPSDARRAHQQGLRAAPPRRERRHTTRRRGDGQGAAACPC